MDVYGVDGGGGNGGEAKSKQPTHTQTILQYYNEIGARILFVRKQKDIIRNPYIIRETICIRNIYSTNKQSFILSFFFCSSFG